MLFCLVAWVAYFLVGLRVVAGFRWVVGFGDLVSVGLN